MTIRSKERPRQGEAYRGYPSEYKTDAMIAAREVFHDLIIPLQENIE